MLVKVVGFSQEMDFEGGDITNFVTLQLPNGKMVKAVVSDDGARQLIEARAASGPLPSRPHETPEAEEQPAFTHSEFAMDDEEQEEEEGAVVFGGNGSSTPAPEGFWTPGGTQDAPPPAHPVAQPSPSFSHADPAVQQKLFQQHQREQRERQRRGPTMGRTVPKDDRGNPIVPNNGGVDVSQVVGGGGGVTDEDGVGQF